MENFYQLQLDVIQGKANGKILWQPRIGCWYDDKLFAGESLPGVFAGKNIVGVYEELQCSNRIYEYNACYRCIDGEEIKRSKQELSALETEERIDTPIGSITTVIKRNTSNGGSFPSKWWVENEEDLKVMGYVLSKQTYEWDEACYQSIKKKWGNIGAPTMFMPRVNIQYLYIDLMGVENAVYALADYPKEVEAFFFILEENQDRLTQVINASPVKMINFGDNLHCGLLPSYYFEQYVLPAYKRRCKILHEGGKFLTAHWDGDTKELLKYVKETGLDGIEAITPKPQGDVTLKEVKEALGDDIWLVDGLAAILFDQQFSEEELMAQVEECITLFAPKLILGISDELSSTGDVERVRKISQWIHEYNRERD